MVYAVHFKILVELNELDSMDWRRRRALRMNDLSTAVAEWGLATLGQGRVVENREGGEGRAQNLKATPPVMRL